MSSADLDHQRRLHLGDALKKVHELVSIPLSEDVPVIQAANFSVLYQANTDTNFGDVIAFKSAFAGSAEDAMVFAQLNNLYNQGQEYAIMLYTWRSISRALPHEMAISRFVSELKRLARKDHKTYFINQAYMLMLGKMLTM
ncbi:unnamed protein product, partial [Dibothriocephalus latus]